MLNFRKLKQDFSSSVVKEGRDLFDKQKVVSAKILHLDNRILRISGRVQGQFENNYESNIEIDRIECETVDSDCDCPYNYDCVHLAALLFYLEERLDEIMVSYSKETDLQGLAEENDLNEEETQALIDKFKEAKTKHSQKEEELYQKQVLDEYINSSEMLSFSPFFRASEKIEIDKAEPAFIFTIPANLEGRAPVELQMALRLPSRSKPLHIPYIKNFFESIRYGETIFLGNKRYRFNTHSFPQVHAEIIKMLIDQSRFHEQPASEKAHRVALIEPELFGIILSKVFDTAVSQVSEGSYSCQDDDFPALTGLYEGSLDVPLQFSLNPAYLKFIIEYMKPPVSKILLNPTIVLNQKVMEIEEVKLLSCAIPGMLYQNVYYRFQEHITRVHLKSLSCIRDVAIPEPLFGSLVENAIPELSRFAEIENVSALENFVTMPFVGAVRATCDIGYLDGELDAKLFFHYEGERIPSAARQIKYQNVASFITPQGVLARNLVEERKIMDELFQDFSYNPEDGVYVTKSEKKIVEFMTDLIPRFQENITFNCPQNLKDQFIYDQTVFNLNLKHTSRIDVYEIQMNVSGALKGVSLDLLWECVASRRSFIELDFSKNKSHRAADGSKISKILVLELNKINALVQLFDELGITVLSDSTVERPLWSLANIDASHFKDLPVNFAISDQLVEIRKQMLGEKHFEFSSVPKGIKASLRPYQKEGVQWLERLRLMYLNGILADDMGLGKTLQAIVAISQHKEKSGSVSLIVCPTSLLYNWKEEFSKFDPSIKVLVVDGVPSARKKLIETISSYDIVVTTYTLIQKDIESYKQTVFSYAILDEAQHIKNRGTRNAKSVKMLQANHKLILSGTPIENSLDEMWSLFDFLMPGFLSSYDRFVERYIRVSGEEQQRNIEYLRKKVAPFILRRMKSDVLDDLPPISEIEYHCQLSDVQKDLYKSYAASAKDELVKLVERDGFDRVQIHVLATLTRLKQICCHPAIFAKEKAEIGDSAKYEMLTDLLQTLVEGKHKTVIFSQYTRMLQIMKDDLEQKGIRFLYLDGSSKNRLEIVQQFNEDESISVFLVSLKAGGTGLNLTGADTVIHYDMWWNPAVENQATDRVHRMGQKKNVSAYKLITLGTIEEKIVEMQKRKKGLVKKVVSCDDEAISKLTWEEVLELLTT